MKLTFTGQPATAATTILAGTSLRYLVSESGPIRSTVVTMYREDDGTHWVDGVALEFDDGWRWSSGEERLLDLLTDISDGQDSTVALAQVDDRCDSETVRVCRAAVALLDAA
jgi:hypothetical protein